MASSDRTDKSMTQKDGCWFTAQPDPTSMECDKLLELGISPEHSSSKSIVFGSSFHKSHPCFKGRSDSSGQLRSHSEETHDPAALICMRENLQNTPSMSSYSCSSGFSLPYSPSVPHHLHSSFKVQNPTVNLPQTCSDLSPSADVDSNLTSHAPAVPPPMALINVNRLSGQNFSSSLLTSNKLDISDHRPCSVKTKPQQTLLSLRTASNVNLGSADSLTSSGTSSWFGCGNTGGSEEHTKTESFLLSGSEALESRYVDTSARDSGLSSHSSNSTNVPINLTHCDRKVPTKTPKSSSPPPVPPHAPNSRAAASLAAKSKQGRIILECL
ncbi:unnamed protein product [Calicophoron daubneyi]|uniref:Uncharacterized protein n=1 Tax=Calicophoron daubneyi TaxID=300641 RepID=A0AAV2TNS4_CALDB